MSVCWHISPNSELCLHQISLAHADMIVMNSISVIAFKKFSQDMILAY